MSRSKHLKTEKPSDASLRVNPGIGASKGTTMSGGVDFEEIEGENTFEGDIENDTNRHGGIDKREARRGR